MIAEFKNQNFEYIVDRDLDNQEIRTEIGDFIDYINIGYNNVTSKLQKPKFSGLEFLKCSCHKCEKAIYRLSGVVTPDREVDDWSCNQWNYHQHATPQDLSDRILKKVIPKIHDISVIQDIKTTPINNHGEVICPLCNHKQKFGFFGDSKRINALHDNDARLEKLIYKPVSLTLDYETMLNTGHRRECSQYSIGLPYKPYLWLYKHY